MNIALLATAVVATLMFPLIVVVHALAGNKIKNSPAARPVGTVIVSIPPVPLMVVTRCVGAIVVAVATAADATLIGAPRAAHVPPLWLDEAVMQRYIAG